MKKTLVVILVVALVVLVAGAGGYFGYQYYRNTHVFIEDAVYEGDATYLDLRGTGISMEHYDQLRQLLPDCEVEWDVPFQGRTLPNYTKELTITTLAHEDMLALSYFPKLRSIDASGCRDYAALEILRYSFPELEVRYTVDLGGASADPSAMELTLEDGSYEYGTMLENLIYLPRLTSLNFPKTNLSLEQLEQVALTYPNVTLDYSVSFRGQDCDPAITELNLSDITPGEVAQVAAELAFFPNLASVELMAADGSSQLSLTDVQTLQEAAPGATFHYTFSFYKQTLSTTDTYVEFKNQYMKDSDEQTIRQILDIMDDCEKIVFNNCHISNEVMAQLRDDYRDTTQVVWRVFFGNGGSCLTDREVIKMVYGLTNANSKALMYCENAKYLDFGHNESLTDISFIAHMPNLEAVILSGSPIRDLAPFKDHKNIYFLEIAYCGYIEDLSPLAGCTNLGMLNLSYTAITDLSQLDGLNLERLTFVKTDVEQEEIDRYMEQHPECWVVYQGDQPYGKGWRYDEDGSQSAYYKKIAAADIFNYAHASDTNW